jgi:CheY-like chemotaxis protein
MKILIIEDEKNLARAIKKGLEDHAFTAEISFDGEEGLYMAETFDFDEVLLDITALGANGETLEKITYSMSQEMGTALEKGKKRVVPFAFSEKNPPLAAVRASLKRADFERKNITPLSQKTFTLK